MTKYYFFWQVPQLLCWVAAEESCVNTFYGITEDVRFKICCLKLKCCNCSIPYWIFSSKWPIMSDIHHVNFGVICKVSWITEWCYVHNFLGLYWYPKVSVWRGSNGAWCIQTVVQKEVMHVLWSVGVCLLHMHLQRWKVLLFCNWLSTCAHGLVVLCEAAIVLQSKIYQSVQGCCNWSNPKSDNKPYVLITFPAFFWICI